MGRLALTQPLDTPAFAAREPYGLALSHLPHPTYVEREVVFIARPDEVARHLDLTVATVVPIAQSYFSREKIPFLLAITSMNLDLHWGPAAELITNARIRHSRIGALDAFELGVKTPRPPGVPIERNEVALPLSQHAFELLSQVVCPRHLQKYRIYLDGSVRGAHRMETVTAHIDIIIDAGPHLAAGLPASLPTLGECFAERAFVTIDVELPSRSLVAPLRRGHHTFPFLSHAVELSSTSNGVRGALSTRRLASVGIDRKARVTARRLLNED